MNFQDKYEEIKKQLTAEQMIGFEIGSSFGLAQAFSMAELLRGNAEMISIALKTNAEKHAKALDDGLEKLVKR